MVDPTFITNSIYYYDVSYIHRNLHATSAVDYRRNKEMRMAATVCVADLNERNVENIMDHYTQAIPPEIVACF